MATSATTGTAPIGLEELPRTGRGTLMGELLRRFWHPVAVADEVPRGRAIPIRIMGEDLTLYRGESGAAHIVAARCAHRCNVLHTGWVQDENIRCMYHGWMYDGTGQCVEAPAEDRDFPRRIRIPAYPVREYAGLIFGYLGPGEPPEFQLAHHAELGPLGAADGPRVAAGGGTAASMAVGPADRNGAAASPTQHSALSTQHSALEGVRWIGKRIWPMNWLQAVENSLDAAHVSFVHRWGRLGTFGAAVTDVLPDLEYIETESGIRQIARRSADNVRISDWTFPNHNHIVVPGLRPNHPWTHTLAWVVPADDEHVVRLVCQFSPARGEAAEELTAYLLSHGHEPTAEPGRYFGRHYYDPSEHHDELFFERKCPEPALNELTSAQDYVAQVGQGSMVDRRLEHLGRSDAGVVFLRNIFLREMAALRHGRPLKQWARRGEAVDLPVQPGPVASGGDGWDRAGVTATASSAALS